MNFSISQTSSCEEGTPVSGGGGIDAKEAYARSGVDVDAFDTFIHRLRNRLVDAPAAAGKEREFNGAGGVFGTLGGFGAALDPKAHDLNDPIFVTACDGVGTKLLLAQRLNRHDTIGIDLVAMCVNDLICHGAKPLHFLDYLAVGSIDSEQLNAIMEGVLQGCELAGTALVGGETAEMPGVYGRGEYELAGFALGAFEREGHLPRREEIKAGDKIIGLASSGLHSNGFSLVNSIINAAKVDLAAPPPPEFFRDAAPDAPSSLGEVLLTPTRIYVKPLLECLSKHGVGGVIRAVAHITGGGFADNISRVIPNEVTAQVDTGTAKVTAQVDLGTVEVPPVFRWLSSVGGLDMNSLHTTFNCGMGLAIVVAGEHAQGVVQTLCDAGERAWIAGEILPRSGDDVTVKLVGSLA